MKVNVDLSMAEMVYEYLLIGDYDNNIKFNNLIESLSTLDSFSKMLQFYQGMFDKDQYAKILYFALNNMDYETTDESLSTLYKNLSRLRDTELVGRKLKMVLNYNFEALEIKLSETLPEKIEQEVNIIFLFDGINGGSILGENNMLMNVMLWPSRENNLHLIEGILLHEYHHIGIKQILKKESYLKNNKRDCVEFSKYLLAVIMSEGAATYLFNESQDLFPLILESHGIEYATMYQHSMNLRFHKMPNLIHEFEQDVVLLLKSIETNIGNDMIEKYCYNTEGVEPRDKAIGYHMCKTIDVSFGRNHLIKCLKNPIIFLTEYARVDCLESNLKFTEEFIRKYENIFDI